MSNLYPTLEDLKVDQMVQAQLPYMAPVGGLAYTSPSAPTVQHSSSVLYPSLNDYMGLEITPQMREQNMSLVPAYDQRAVTSVSSGSTALVSGSTNVGLSRAEISQGVHQVTLCKDQTGKIGLQVRAVDKGIFVAFVHVSSPAALAGLHFGDQILQVNGENVAGWSTDKATKFLKNAAPERITLAIRDRPFERTVTLVKDSHGTVGFVFNGNKITALVKDSSAARNGLLTDHHIVEVNGQNVVGLKELEIKEVIDTSGPTVTITVIPSFIYEHIMKNIGSSLVAKFMDHSIPDL